jgi:hypothetical protein
MFYTVQGLQKEPLSATDQDIVDRVDLDDLKRRVTPPTRENVEKRIARIMGTEVSEAAGIAAPVKTSSTVVAAKKAVSPVVESQDSKTSDEFPDYDDASSN